MQWQHRWSTWGSASSTADRVPAVAAGRGPSSKRLGAACWMVPSSRSTRTRGISNGLAPMNSTRRICCPALGPASGGSLGATGVSWSVSSSGTCAVLLSWATHVGRWRRLSRLRRGRWWLGWGVVHRDGGSGGFVTSEPARAPGGSWLRCSLGQRWCRFRRRGRCLVHRVALPPSWYLIRGKLRRRV
jgi:hypothetical protein